MAFTLPNEYGYVLMAAASTGLVGWLHTAVTITWRNYSGVKFPNAYATEEVAAKDKNAATFNCAQRAHANFMENHTTFLGFLGMAGIRHPISAAYLGLGWTLARLAYLYGYIKRGPPGRHPWFSLSSFISFITAMLAIRTSYSIIIGDSL